MDKYWYVYFLLVLIVTTVACSDSKKENENSQKTETSKGKQKSADSYVSPIPIRPRNLAVEKLLLSDIVPPEKTESESSSSKKDASSSLQTSLNPHARPFLPPSVAIGRGNVVEPPALNPHAPIFFPPPVAIGHVNVVEEMAISARQVVILDRNGIIWKLRNFRMSPHKIGKEIEHLLKDKVLVGYRLYLFLKKVNQRYEKWLVRDLACLVKFCDVILPTIYSPHHLVEHFLQLPTSTTRKDYTDEEINARDSLALYDHFKADWELDIHTLIGVSSHRLGLSLNTDTRYRLHCNPEDLREDYQLKENHRGIGYDIASDGSVMSFAIVDHTGKDIYYNHRNSERYSETEFKNLVSGFFKNKVVVGHAIVNLFDESTWREQQAIVYDTEILHEGKTLKELAKEHLRVDFRRELTSIQKAKIALQIFKLRRLELVNKSYVFPMKNSTSS